eukprot:jgi/Mesvir1/27439/Mv07227-RA.2
MNHKDGMPAMQAAYEEDLHARALRRISAVSSHLSGTPARTASIQQSPCDNGSDAGSKELPLPDSYTAGAAASYERASASECLVGNPARSNTEESDVFCRERRAWDTAPGCGPSGIGAPRSNCIFCKIVEGAAPCFKVYEDSECICILDINPLTAGHCLIIPRVHIPELAKCPPSVAAAVAAALPTVSSAVLAATHSSAFNVLVNCGAEAGQVIPHVSTNRQMTVPVWGLWGEV